MELALVAILVVLTVGSTIRFYLRHGQPGLYLRYCVPGLVIASYLARSIVSRETYLVWSICIGWSLYLCATSFIRMCESVEDFRGGYRKTFAGLYLAWIILKAVELTRQEANIANILYCGLAGLLVLSFVGMISYPRGRIIFFQLTFTAQVCVWMTLSTVLASGQLFELPQGPKQPDFVWRFIVDDKFNLEGINAVSETLTRKYGSAFIGTYMYFLLSLLYHGLLRPRDRNVAVRSYAAVLIYLLYSSVPEARDALASIPFVGKQIASPLVLLCATLTAVFLVLASLAKAERDRDLDW